VQWCCYLAKLGGIASAAKALDPSSFLLMWVVVVSVIGQRVLDNRLIRILRGEVTRMQKMQITCEAVRIHAIDFPGSRMKRWCRAMEDR
jgi:ABC-type Na+ efflux pump permease subunit